MELCQETSPDFSQEPHSSNLDARTFDMAPWEQPVHNNLAVCSLCLLSRGFSAALRSPPEFTPPYFVGRNVTGAGCVQPFERWRNVHCPSLVSQNPCWLGFSKLETSRHCSILPLLATQEMSCFSLLFLFIPFQRVKPCRSRQRNRQLRLRSRHKKQKPNRDGASCRSPAETRAGSD